MEERKKFLRKERIFEYLENIKIRFVPALRPIYPIRKNVFVKIWI